MWLIYFDTSALAKRYSREQGSDLVNEVFQTVPLKQMRCSTLAMLEIVSILVRKRNSGKLTRKEFSQALTNFNDEVVKPSGIPAVLVDDALLRSAVPLISKHNLNASDAVLLHLAILLNSEALVSGNRLMFWTSDHRLARAAAAESLTVFNPETETSANLTTLLTTN